MLYVKTGSQACLHHSQHSCLVPAMDFYFRVILRISISGYLGRWGTPEALESKQTIYRL